MIGREGEKKYLLSLLEEDESQFVAVFGRRRVVMLSKTLC